MAGSVGQYTQGWFPWMGVKSSVGGWSRVVDAVLGMGYWDNIGSYAQNDEFVVSLYCDTGTWKTCIVCDTYNTCGIATFTLGSTAFGTIDTYSAGFVENVYLEATGNANIAQVGDFKMKLATKNASSSAYRFINNSIALIRTSGIASIPGGTDTPGYTWQHFPWMGNKVEVVGTYKHQAGSTELGGGNGYLLGGALNDYVDNDVWFDTGTYKYAQVAWKTVDQGIASIQLDTVEQGIIDNYTGSANVNVYAEITGISIATAGTKIFRQKATSKNASSSAYYMVTQSVAWIRTGA